MSRYITRRPRAEADCDGWYESPLITSVEVVEREPQFTGLLDDKGNEIWRTSDPIGFRFDD